MVKETQTINEGSGGRKWRKVLLVILICVLLFLLLLPLLLHIGFVQNWLADKISDKISDKTKTQVDIGFIDFSIFEGLILEDVTITDAKVAADTIFNVDAFSTSLSQNLFSYFKDEILLDELSLRGAQIRVITEVGDSTSRLEKFLSSLGSSNKPKNKKQSEKKIDIRKMSVEDIEILIEDREKGSKQRIALSEGEILIDELDLKQKYYAIENLFLVNPIYEEVIGVSKNKTKKVKSGDKHQGGSSTYELRIDHVQIKEGILYRSENPRASYQVSDGFDSANLNISDINFIADSLLIKDPNCLKGSIEALTLSEASGFDIEGFKVGQLQVDTSVFRLEAFNLNTKYSTMGQYLEFSYDSFADFKDFARKIEIDAELENSKLAVKDLSYFFPEIKSNKIMKNNLDKWLNIDGYVSGTINDLEGDDLDFSFSDLIRLKGYVSLSDLMSPDDALVNMHVEELSTGLSQLKSVIPGFDPPEQFLKLDPIVFTGDIDGFLKDFVLFGNLTSPLGNVEFDTRLDIKRGNELANYSGDIYLTDFDIGRWTDDPKFGKATLQASVEEGRGLTLDSLYMKLNSSLEKFEYQGYTYKDVDMTGVIRKNSFDGLLASTDPNASFEFSGGVKVVDGVMVSDFDSRIENLDLKTLNLSEDFEKINGDVELRLEGGTVDDFIGTANLKDLDLVYKGKDFNFDSLFITSSPETNGERNLGVSSNVINGYVNGKFNFSELPVILNNYFFETYPEWTELLDVKRKSGILQDQDFRYKVKVTDTKDYLELIGVNGLRMVEMDLSGTFNSKHDQYKTQLRLDTAFYNDIVLQGMDLEVKEINNKGSNRINLDGISIGSIEINPVSITSKLSGRELQLNIQTRQLLDSVEHINLNMLLEPNGERLLARFTESELRMFSSDWYVNPQNSIEYGKGYIDINNLEFLDNKRAIVINDINNKGIQAELDDFDFLLINSIIDYDKIEFSGEGDLKISKSDIFNPSFVEVDAHLPRFYLNKVNYGRLQVIAFERTSGAYSLGVNLERADGLLLDISAEYDKESDKIDGRIDGRNLPMNTFEFIIDDGISGTAGEAFVSSEISGTSKNIEIDGEAFVLGGKTTIDYLGAELNLGDEKFIVTHEQIDLTGTTLSDKLGNTAQMRGGLFHDLFTDFRTDLTMSSEYFMALDTEKMDNPSYYGTGMGDITVDFLGPFSSTDINVVATTGPGTVLNIPVGDSYEDFSESFIKVVDRNDVLQLGRDSLVVETPKLEGVDVRMNLTLNEDADVNIIFNEATGDIIQGKGEGNMRVVMSRKGDFNIFGNYIISEGEYLFTYFGGIISKPFTVLRGGEITWTGDPINASINLEATYEKLKAPVNVFLAEYLVGSSGPRLANASQRTEIDLKMYITGTLYEPEVNFDIEFPDLRGDLKTLADTKMRLLRENEADLNEQVAGLIMFGSFLPSTSLGSTVGSTSGLARTGYNTLSEMVSNQLSYLLSGFLQEALTENGFISGIDFDVGFSKNSEFGDDLVGGPVATNNSIIPDEIEVHLKPRFQNDRWEIDYGTAYVNSATNIQNYVIHDFVISFFLTEDRKLKLRAYGRFDRNFNGDPDQRYGVGINYRKEFGSLVDFRKALTDDLSKLKKDDID